MKSQVTIHWEKQHEIIEYETNYNTKKIDLSNLQITEIQPHSFNKYQTLRVLNMSNNTIFVFPPQSIFLFSRNLRYYFCNNCGITVIYEETFKGLPILSTIELKGNNIQQIMPETFNYVPKISILNLESNQIKGFNSEGFLKFPPSFHTLSMNNNKDFKLPVNKEFIIAEKLTSFECNFCNIHEIFIESFSLVPEIVNLELKNNNMDRIDFSAFENNPKLDYLCLDNNPLSENNFNFASKSLQQIYCSNCSFTKIKKNTFSNFENLIKMKLRDNTISLIEENSFNKNPVLNLIDLGSNHIKEFPINLIEDAIYLKNLVVDARDLCPKYNIKELKNVYEERKLSGTDFDFEIVDNVQGNVLHKNCPKIQYIESETTIDISNRNISYIDPDFFGSHIRILIMNHNRNFKFPEDKPFLHIHHLEEYHCNSCGIEEITSKAFTKLPNLIKIELRNNGIKTIANEAFKYNINLQDLYLSDNSLSILNDNIFETNTKLSKLDISNNPNFSKFPESNSLQILNMSNCQIRELSYQRFEHLRILDLSFNEISSIDEHVFEKRLEELYLDSNKIEKFPAKLLENNKLLKLCLDQNPLSFNYNEDIVALKEIYIEKYFRSQRCLGNRNEMISKFEDSIPDRTTTTTTTAPTTTTASTTTNKPITSTIAPTIITFTNNESSNKQITTTDINVLVDEIDSSHDNRIDPKKREAYVDGGKDEERNISNENEEYAAGMFRNESTVKSNSILCMLVALSISLIYTYE